MPSRVWWFHGDDGSMLLIDSSYKESDYSCIQLVSIDYYYQYIETCFIVYVILYHLMVGLCVFFLVNACWNWWMFCFVVDSLDSLSDCYCFLASWDAKKFFAASPPRCYINPYKICKIICCSLLFLAGLPCIEWNPTKKLSNDIIHFVMLKLASEKIVKNLPKANRLMLLVSWRFFNCENPGLCDHIYNISSYSEHNNIQNIAFLKVCLLSNSFSIITLTPIILSYIFPW